MAEKIYGYFTDGAQTEPAYDPGLGVPCPICSKELNPDDIRTISLAPIQRETERLKIEGERSYFYRVHRSCHEPLTAEQRTRVDGLLIDAIASIRSTN
jgi:hypothetical protein